MGKRAGKEKMRILALGNKAFNDKARLSLLPPFQRASSARGFTLLELLVVVAIIAIASAGVVFAIPDASHSALERDAQRLAALLDSARAQSRASGLAVYWQATPEGFKFEGLPQTKNSNTGEIQDVSKLPSNWLSLDTSADPGSRLALGPEPIIARQEVVLHNAGRSLTLATDGLRPFSMNPTPKAEAL